MSTKLSVGLFFVAFLVTGVAVAQYLDKPGANDADQPIGKLIREGFPVFDYHVHLKGGLTIDEVLAHQRATGIRCGVAANCGKMFPITDDAGIENFIASMRGYSVRLGMQAEGREWVTMFSPEAVAKFDYVFTDAMTIFDHRGKRARLWMPDEVDIPDAEAFMERLVKTIEEILTNEPIDIYVNPTYLPAVIAKDYDKLWTAARKNRVIDAAAKNSIAIEINSKLKLPKADFIKAAKAKGIKFSMGTNNGDKNLGKLEYSIEMVRECGLTGADMFKPKPNGKKPVQVKGFKK